MKIKLCVLMTAIFCLAISVSAQKTLKMDMKIDRTTPVEKTLATNEQAA